MPIDYRYHIGSFVAIFVALLLGILIGIGLSFSPEELARVQEELRADYQETREFKQEELHALREANREYDSLARKTVPAIIGQRLSGRRVAIVLDHEFGRDPLPDNLRALLRQAGATVTSTTTITPDFVSLPTAVRQNVSERLSLYPPPGVHFRTIIAQSIAKDLAQGRPDLILDLYPSGLLRFTADSDYTLPPDAVVFVGGLNSPQDAAPERIDLPMIEELTGLGVRVVGCEARDASISCIPLYKTKDIATVDNADTPAGRLAIVLALAGADGHFGVKDTRDRFLPDISLEAGH
ncbi:MAG: copper transporter [Armatimonadota bacterium]|nr:MAG: copper transporter [Armatimonadota bacterium]